MFSFDITEQNFKQVVLDNSQTVPVLIDIWAPWCEPCKILKPLLEKLADEYQGRFILAKLNAEEQQALAGQFKARSIPTVKVIYQGQLVNEFTGALPEAELRTFIDSVIPSPIEELRAQATEKTRGAEFEAALALLDAALALDSDHVQVKTDKAAVLIALGNHTDAKQLLEALPQASKSDEKVKEMLTWIELQESTAGLADAATLQQAVADNPADLQARLDLARLCMAQKHYETAVEQLFEIIRRDRQFEDDIGRKTMLDIFTLLGNGHALVRTARRQLSALLN